MFSVGERLRLYCYLFGVKVAGNAVVEDREYREGLGEVVDFKVSDRLARALLYSDEDKVYATVKGRTYEGAVVYRRDNLVSVGGWRFVPVEERRNSLRVKVPYYHARAKVIAHDLKKGEVSTHARAVDVGEGGIGLEVPADFEADEVVVEWNGLILSGKVVQTVALGDDRKRLCVKFDSLSPELNRAIRSYLLSRQKEVARLIAGG